MEAVKTFVFIAVLPSVVLAGPVKYSWPGARASDDGVSISQCSTECTDATKFGYQVGRSYRYAYEVTGTSSIPGASEQTSQVFASANAYFHVISKCEMALKLRDVTFKTSDPDTSTLRDAGDFQYTSSLEENFLYFSFQDGRVDEVCPMANEDPEILNFKRGVISAFQISMSQHLSDQSMREVDVSGNCPTDYVVTQKGWKSTRITKTKDLLACTDRQHYKTALQSTPFQVPDAIQSLPLLKGDHKCSLTLSKDGILSLASCVESLIFRPFSRKESGAKTVTVQKLEYIDSGSDNFFRGTISRRTSLSFEHVMRGDMENPEIWAVRDKLEEMCKASSPGVEKQVPGYFSELVYLMKEIPNSAMKDLWSSVETGLISNDCKDLAREFILDALPTVGTEASLHIMTEFLLYNEVTGIRASIWLKSLAFLQNPTQAMIRNSFKRLLNSEKMKDSLLPVTSAIHNYCLERADCQSDQAVTDVVAILENILGRDCRSADKDLTLTVLRAAGNLGFSDNLVSTLENCIEMSANSMDVRVTAVQAFRGVTCNAKRSSLLDVYVNKGEDSELRINAYLGLMMCPSPVVLQKVKQTLEAEEVNQVGSFVWTHLTNLAESSSPHKQELKAILQDKKLQKEFDMDKRKYSRNYELSYFSDKFGTGATVESNLIWSSSSFLPRSAMLNLTADVLGHSMNLFEVGGRVTGLQELLQDYVGKKLKTFNQAGKSDGCGRQGKMDDMKEKHGVDEEKLSGSVYLRMFGNELEYKHFTEKDITAFKNQFNAKDMMKSLSKGEDISFTHSAMFLDSTVTVPTIAGMALKLSVNGTATVQLKASGKMDLRRLSMKRMQIHFDLAPSGAVQIGGEMTLNAGAMKSGLKMTTTLHSSTAFSGRLDLTNGQVLSIVADTPRDKMEIFDMQSEFFIIHMNAVRPQKMLEEKAAIQQKGCSDKLWLKVLGYELCGDVSYVNATQFRDAPYFPLTGPLSGRLVLHKRDAPQGFKLTAEAMDTKDTVLGRLSIDTPGSKTDRNLAANYFTDKMAHTMEAEVVSPWKKVTAKGSYSTGPKTWKVSGSLAIDQRNHEFVFKVDRDQKKNKITWTPSLQVTRPWLLEQVMQEPPETMGFGGSVSYTETLDEMSADIDLMTNIRADPIKLQANYINKKTQVTVSGAAILNRKESYSGTFQVMETFTGKNDYPSKIKPTILISAPSGRLFLLSGNVDFKKNKALKTNLQITMEKTLKEPIDFSLKGTKSKSKFKGSGKLSGQFGIIKSKGYIDIPLEAKKKGIVLTTKITTSYSLGFIKDRSLRRNLVIFSSKIHDRSTKSLMKYDGSVIVDSRNYQKASFVSGVSFSHSSSLTKTVITYNGGAKSKNLKDKSRQLRVEATLDHKIAKKDVEIKYDMQILYPIKAIEWQINGKHEHHLNKKIAIETYNSFIYAKGKNSEFRFKIDDNSKKMTKYDGLLEFNYPDFRFNGKRVKGRSYRLISALEQTSRNEYAQSLQVHINRDLEHSMYTKVKYFKNADYQLNSMIEVGSGEDTKVTILSSYLDDKREVSVKVDREGKVYSGATSVSVKKNKYNTTWDVSWPERRVKGSWGMGKDKKSGYTTKFLTLWDADKDVSKQLGADFNYKREESPEMSMFDVDMSLKTPFENYKAFAYKWMTEFAAKSKKAEFKVVWRRPEQEFSYKVWLLTPVSLRRFQLDFEIVTPLERLRMYRTEIRHKFAAPNYLSTSVVSKYNENDVSGDILVSSRKNELQNKQECLLELNFVGAKRDSLEMQIGDFDDVSASEPLTPDMPKVIKFRLSHDNDGRVYNSEMSSKVDEKNSKVDHRATYTRAGKIMNLKSKLDVFLEDFMTDPFHIELTHANTLTNLNTTVTSKWGDAQRANLDVGIVFMEHDQSLYVHYSGTTESIHDLIYKHHHSNLNGWSGSSFSQVNRDIRMQSGSKYKVTKTEFSYESFSPSYKSIVTAEYDNYPYTGYIKYSFMEPGTTEWQHVVVDGSVVKNKEKDWTGDFRLVTPFERVKNVDVKGNLKDVGKKTWELDGNISYGLRKEIKMKASVDVEKFSKIKAELESPWKNVELDITHTKQKKNAKAQVRVKYDGDKEIVAKFNGRLRFPHKSILNLDLSTPYEEVRSAHLKGYLMKTNDKVSGEINIKSSNDKMKSFNLNFGNELREGYFDQNIEITSSAFDKVELRCMMEIEDKQNAFEAKLIAPVVGRNILGFKTRSNSWVDFTQRWYGEVKGHDLDMGYGLKHEESQTDAFLTFNYPGAEKSFVSANVHRTFNSLMDFNIGADLQIGKDAVPYNVSAQFSHIKYNTAVGATLTSPFTKPVSMLIKQEVTKTGETKTLYGNYDDEYKIDLYDMSDLTGNSYESTRRLGYLFKGEGHTVGHSFQAKWVEDGEEFDLKCNYNNYEVTVTGNHVPQEHSADDMDTLDVYLTTPFDQFRDLQFHNFIQRKEKKIYNGKMMLEYMDGKEAELTYDVKKMGNKVTANGVLSLPIDGYKKNTINYVMVNKKNLFTIDAEARMGRGENLKTTVEFRKEEEFIFNLIGPIKEFKNLKIAGKFNKEEKRLSGDLQLQLSLHPRPISLEYDIHVNSEPVVMTFKLRSPYKNYERADLTVNHSGKVWKKSTTTTVLTSEQLGRITLVADMDYDSVSSMEGKVTLTSTVKNMENLRLLVKTNSRNKNDLSSQLEVGWDVDKEIVAKTSWKQDNSGPRTMTFDVDITTPFDDVKVFNFKISESRGYKRHSRSLFVRHNDQTYLDTDMSYTVTRQDMHKATIEMKKPRPMSISVEGQLKDKEFDGKVFLNWDKHKPESQFEFNVHMADKSDESNIDTDFSFKVIHPVRIMAVKYLLQKADKEMKTSGLITWDESKGNTFSYDIGYTDRSSKYSDMYNAHIKVGVPQRSVKLLGSYGDSGTSRTVTGTALWDADRDDRKKVTMSTTHEYAERMERVNLDLNLPSINKQLNVGVTLKRDYGSYILDSKTEISYSSEPRKTIHITHKIYNSVLDNTGRGDYNLTMETGFKHPVTDTDLQWFSYRGKTNDIYNVGHQFTYLTIDGEKKVFACRVETDNDKNGELKITTPLKTVQFVGKRLDQRGKPGFKVDLLEDGVKTMSLAGKLRPRTRELEVTMHYDRDDPQKIMYVNGAYVTDKSVELSLFDSDNVYAKMNAKLNSSHVIHTRIVWQPSLPKDFQVYMSTKVTAFSYITKEIWDATVKSVGTEVKAKYLRVSQELRDEIGQVFALMRKEMEIFNVQLEAMKTKIRRIYNRNDLYIRDMGMQIDGALQELLGSFQDLVKNYRSYYNDVTQATNEWINSLKNYPISLMYGKTIGEMLETLKEIRLALEEVLKEVALELKDVSEVAYKKYMALSRNIDRKLNSYIQSQQKLALFKQMMGEKERLARMGADYKAKDLESFDKVLMQTQQILEDQFHDLMTRVEFQQLHATGTEIYQQFKYWNAERGLSHAITRLLDMSKNLILMELGKIKNVLLDIKKSHVTVYDPMKGELEFEIHMPFAMESFSKPPEFKIGQYAKDAYHWVESRLSPLKNSSLLDLYDSYVPSLKSSQWLPPFEATGYVIGSQGILTFDKTSTEYLSTCSHVLVRDILQDSFSVVLNYDRNPVRNGIRSLCFSFGKSLSLEVSKDYQLTVNGQESEMPFVNDQVRVLREGETISVEYVNGLRVVSNPRIDLHKVTLSGWFHGRTAGLLGVYDNERHNEAAMEGRLYEFEVNRRSCSNQNVAVRPEPSDDVTGSCTDLFQDTDSQFKSCFKQVNPSIFLRMCQVYMSSMEERDALLKVSQQYRSVCRDQGIFMAQLSGSDNVLACNNNEMLDGDKVRNSADVVLVVEDAKCNQWASSYLTNIVTEMNKALTKAGISNNRFGLVGYNGNDVTVRTMHGNHFGKTKSFLKAVETLKLASSEEYGGLVTAVRTAKNYPYRVGVPVKILVVAPCSSCQVGFLESNLDSELKDAGFKVHILQEQGFSLPGYDNKYHRVYGMDNSEVIGHGVANNVGPSSVTLTYNNYCNAMASTTNGSVFDTTYLKRKTQRSFIKAFANKIGNGVSVPECQRCECNPDSEIMECRLCQSYSPVNDYFSLKPSALFYYKDRQ